MIEKEQAIYRFLDNLIPGEFIYKNDGVGCLFNIERSDLYLRYSHHGVEFYICECRVVTKMTRGHDIRKEKNKNRAFYLTHIDEFLEKISDPILKKKFLFNLDLFI